MFAIILGVIIFFALIFIACLINANKNHAEDEREAEIEYERQLSERVLSFGNPSVSVKLSKYDYYEIYNNIYAGASLFR